MAMFGARPEEPTQWAGLPAEPLEDDDVAVLPASADAIAAGGLFGIAPIESIAIPLGGIPAEPDGAEPSDE